MLEIIFVIGDMPICKTEVVKFVVSLVSFKNKML